MAAELRSFYSEDYIGFIADTLTPFGVRKSSFIGDCFNDKWQDLTLKERSAHLTQLLARHLPEDPAEGIEILKKTLPVISAPSAQKYADMLCMFVPDYVLLRRQDLTLEQIKDALQHFTHNGTTSELAVRPFIQDFQDDMMDWMLALSRHKHPNVRRFASEGCRPRLPWAMALPALKKDPSPVFPILEMLKSDDSKFVQKSVANNLNDIAKDNPERVLKFAAVNIDQHDITNWILKHGLRSLLKSGSAQAMSLFGMAEVTVKNAKLTLEHETLSLGEVQTLIFECDLDGPLPDKLRIEYAVDFTKARGKTSRKVFMISELPPKSRKVAVQKPHRFIDHSTRKHYAGTHVLTILINGNEMASAPFDLVLS